jgi:spore germination protein PE
MLTRTSIVDNLTVDILSFSSIIQLGDSCIVNGFSRAIAVQREAEIFYGNEGSFSSYRVFSEPLPFQPIYEPYLFVQHNPNPLIKVNSIKIIGISSASVLHVGNSQNVSMEARIKHIRQIPPTENEQGR